MPPPFALRRIVLAGLAPLALSTSPAFADSAACRAAPTRACVLEAAAAVGDKLSSPGLRANMLAAVASAEARHGTPEAAAALARARTAADALPPDAKPSPKLYAMAGALAEAGDWAGAAAYADGVTEPVTRASAFASLALAAARHGKADEAKANFEKAATAAAAADPGQRSLALSAIAVAKAKAGLPDAAAAFDLAFAADDATPKHGQHGALVIMAIRAHVFVRALIEIPRADSYSQANLYRILVLELARAGRFDDAIAVADQMGDSDRVVDAWVDIAIAQIRAGHAFEGAKSIAKAESIGGPNDLAATRNETKAKLAGAEAVAGMSERAKAHIAETRAAIAAETSDTFRETLTDELALALARAGDTDGAIAAIKDEKLNFFTLSLIGDDQVAAGRYGDAFAAVSTIAPDRGAPFYLIDLADKLPN